MAYKGINTYIEEMKNESSELVNKYLTIGVPIGVIQLQLENIMKDVEVFTQQHIVEEEKQYQEQLKNEESTVGTTED